MVLTLPVASNLFFVRLLSAPTYQFWCGYCLREVRGEGGVGAINANDSDWENSDTFARGAEWLKLHLSADQLATGPYWYDGLGRRVW